MNPQPLISERIRHLALPALGALIVTPHVATAQPSVYMISSSGKLLHADLGSADAPRVVGQDPVFQHGIIGLETDSRGRMWTSQTGVSINGVTTPGAIGRINRNTGQVTLTDSILEHEDLLAEWGFLQGGGLSLRDDGYMWMPDWKFGFGGPLTLLRFNPDTGKYDHSIETDVDNVLYGASVFRDDGYLTMLSYDGDIVVMDVDSGQSISVSTLTGPRFITGLTQYEGITYLTTQYGAIYTFDLDTYEYDLVQSFGTEHGTYWGITVNPTPGTIVPVLSGVGLAARRRRASE